MKKTSLSKVERERALKEGIDPSLVEEIKVKWINALEIVSQNTSRNLLDIDIEYDPKTIKGSIGVNGRGVVPTNIKLLFATPKKSIPFDSYPSLEAKIGVSAHELGHLADLDQYPKAQYREIHSAFGDYLLFEKAIDKEQRASLYAFTLFPREFQALVETRIQSNRKRNCGVETQCGYDVEYVAIETLGEIGMPRTLNVARFYKELCDKGVLSIKYLEDAIKSSLYGLAKSPDSDLNMLTAFDKRDDLDRIFFEYINDKIREEEFEERKRKLGSVQYIGGYNPAKSIDYRWIIRAPAIERLQEEKKRWQRISCTPGVKNDMIVALDYCIQGLEAEIPPVQD